MALVIARLRDRAPSLRLIEGAAQFAKLEAPPPAASMPAAYVVPQRDTAGANNVIGTVRQRIAPTVGVVLVTSNVRDPRGDAAMQDIDALKAEVRAALVGWTPAAGWEPTTAGGGSLVSTNGGAVWWTEIFASAFQLRAPMQED